MIEEVDFTVAWARAVRADPLSPVSGKCILFGYSVRETTGAVGATLQILNGMDATGLEVVGVQLNPSGAARDWFGTQGIRTDVGIFPVITGTVKGAIWVWVSGKD
jgi:hypothetical protein